MAKSKTASKASPKVAAVASKASSASPTASPSSSKSKAAVRRASKRATAAAASAVVVPEVEVSTESEEPRIDLVNAKIASKAVSELANYLTRVAAKKQEEEGESKSLLFDDEDDDKSKLLYVEINTKKFVSAKPQLKPKVLKISNPIYDRSTTRTCLIIRDSFASNPAYVALLEKEHLPTISQILPVEALKTVYKTFEKRRELQAEYDLFLVDDAVFNLMPTLLGKTFYANRDLKIPIQVRVVSSIDKKVISISSFTNSLEKSLDGTAYLPPVGTQISIKVGSINKVFTQEQLVQNVQDVISAFNKDDIVSISVKTTDSPSLPLFYTDKLYDETTDVVEAGAVPAAEETDELSTFEKGLLEFAPAEEVKKVLGEKKQKKTKKPFKVSKPSTK